jgi:hypothetical protein
MKDYDKLNTVVKLKNKLTLRFFTQLQECGPCPIFASYTLAFALQLRKKHRKTCQGRIYIKEHT